MTEGMVTDGAGSPRDPVLGHFDGVFGRVAAGWAYRPSRPSLPVTVQVIAAGRVVGEAVAVGFREDLKQAGIGDGRHGFKCLLPVSLFDGSHAVSVRVKGGTTVLDGGPYPLAGTLPSLGEAFAPEAEDALLLPLTDFQSAMLHGLTRVCEALAEQSGMLRRLAPPPVPGSAVAEPAGFDILRPRSDAERYGPLVEDFRRCRPGLRDVVLFSIIDWGFRVQRPQHLAAALGRMGCRVTYVSVHPQPLDVRLDRFRLRAKPAENVYEVVLRCSAPVPSVYAGIAGPGALAELCLAVEDMMAVLGINGPVALLQYPAWWPVARSIPGACVVFDCLDHTAGFATAGPGVLAMEAELVASADLLVTSSQYLHDRMATLRTSPVIRNAAETEFFAAPPNRRVAYGDGPVIGYHGAVAEWFDGPLLAEVARLRPDWTFVLVGSTDGADIEPLKALPNLRLVGEVPYRELPDHLDAFDCCLIPFRLNELTLATNPVKLYEYFAAGKPVVATDMPELRLVPDGLLRIAGTARGFADAIAAALREGPETAWRRRLWAMENSWTARARAYLDQLDRVTPPVALVLSCGRDPAAVRACLDLVEARSHYPNLRLVLVDEGAGAGTTALLAAWAREKPGACVVPAGAPEAAVAAALAAVDPACVILLDDGARVTDGWVRDLVRPLLLDDGLGVAGPLSNGAGPAAELRYTGPEEMAQAARRLTRPRKGMLRRTDAPGFFCVAIARRVIDHVGLPPARRGREAAEDYGRRVAAAGFGLVVAEGVFVHYR